MTPQTVARQAPLSMKFSGQEYWSGLPFPSPGDLPNPGIEPASALQADSLPFEPPGNSILYLKLIQNNGYISLCCTMYLVAYLLGTWLFESSLPLPSFPLVTGNQ